MDYLNYHFELSKSEILKQENFKLSPKERLEKMKQENPKSFQKLEEKLEEKLEKSRKERAEKKELEKLEELKKEPEMMDTLKLEWFQESYDYLERGLKEISFFKLSLPKRNERREKTEQKDRLIKYFGDKIFNERDEWIKNKKDSLKEDQNIKIYNELYTFISKELLYNSNYKDYYSHITNLILEQSEYLKDDFERLTELKTKFKNSISYYKKNLIKYIQLKNLGIHDPTYAFLE